MKRSSMIFLGATGLLIAGAWLGRSGGPVSDTDKAEIYDSLSACISGNTLTREQCQDEFAAAEAKHLAEAPRFNAQGDCEAQYGAGQCKPATIAGTSYFLPALAGVMIAQRLLGQRQPQALLPPLRAQQPCAPGFTPATQPGCVVQRSSSSSSSSGSAGGWRSYSTAAGTAVSRDASRPGPVTVPRSVTTGRGSVPSVGTSSSSSSQGSTVSRGGFGSTASSTSSSSSS